MAYGQYNSTYGSYGMDTLRVSTTTIFKGWGYLFYTGKSKVYRVEKHFVSFSHGTKIDWYHRTEYFVSALRVTSQSMIEQGNFDNFPVEKCTSSTCEKQQVPPT